jgi:uncharacterized protein YbjT (DUF2867 family)
LKKVILFGATGNLGKHIVQELISKGYELTVVVRDPSKAKELFDDNTKLVNAEVCSKSTLADICQNQEIVVSALGKSISPHDKSKPGFEEVDFAGNMNILEEAIKSGVKKFVYVSAFHAEKYLHLTYFNVHHRFPEELKKSGIDYSIIKPPAIFSAFIDMMDMAKKGQLVTIGKGDKKTNPIFEGDLAKICVGSIAENNKTIEAGGRSVYTGKELNLIVQQEVDKNKQVRQIPLGFFKAALPVLKIFNKNLYDKFAFFVGVIQHDTIAPQLGGLSFEDYIKSKILYHSIGD